MVVKNKKKHQKSHNSNVNVGEDKISNLPEALIHRILSFLPTKCAMSTCILSKRWKNVSNSIPTLDFRNWRIVQRTVKEKRLETQQFMDFVDTVLCLHEKPNIQKFYLTWDNSFDESRVNKWIGIVIKRKVEELFLSLTSRTPFIFPLSLFTCDSLTVLELDKVILNVPNTVFLPRVKILRLRNMIFVNVISTNKLFSNCPILEDLSLISCGCFKCEVLCIANLALKNLCIRHCNFRESTVKICAPNLSTISYGQVLPVDFVIDGFPSLVEADIDIYHYDGSNTAALVKIFKKLVNVKLLKVNGNSFQVLCKAEIPFDNLINLEVSSICVVSNMQIFLRFLQLSPSLESIVFAQYLFIYDKEDDGCSSLDPICSLPHLKSVKFMLVEGLSEELNAIELFLKYARFLETVIVVASPRLSKDHEEQLRVAKLLLMFPRSGNCVVKFLTSYEKA